ncbi:polysaccharide deacetylase [Candidatus Magnetoovum chiemensis]|nr:polysaccharide deacetylase [Candidatus Magnetoovum chiemensis]
MPILCYHKKMAKTFILTYHNISKPLKYISHQGLYVTPRMFDLQMRYLKFSGFKAVSLFEMLDILNGSYKYNSNVVSLTFDDGYEDFDENAFPILRKYGFCATVFIVSDLIGKTNAWDRGQMHSVKKFLMDWQRIRYLSSQGVYFGCHSKTHPSLVKIGKEQLEAELIDSKKDIEMRLDKKIDFFCYPYGDYNDHVKEEVKKAGYSLALTTKRGPIEPATDAFALPRVSIKLKTNPIFFAYKLHTNYEKRKGEK